MRETMARGASLPAGMLVHDDAAFAALLGGERGRVVALCARITGRADEAEDLAHETLAEAWRLRGRLYDVTGLHPWLDAIARNVCRRWARGRGHESALRAQPSLAPTLAGEAATSDVQRADTLADDDPAVDPAVAVLAAVEREAIATMLGNALGRLAPQARAALLAVHAEGLTYDEAAARLGVSPATLRVRLHRGRAALRALFATTLRDEAADLDLYIPRDDVKMGDDELPGAMWRTTRIWCPFCGAAPLRTLLDPASGRLAYRCTAGCVIIGGGRAPDLLGTLTSAKAILTRCLLHLGERYRHTLAAGTLTCTVCGQPLRTTVVSPLAVMQPGWDGSQPYGLAHACPRCGLADGATIWHLLLDSPEAQRFWRAHPRMRALPPREVETEGRPAVVAGFVARDSDARIEYVSDRETLALLHVAATP